MNRKFFGALTLAAVVTGGCMNPDISSMRRSAATEMASFAEAPPALESQVNDRAGRSQAAQVPAAAKQPEPQKSDRKLIRNGEMTIEVKSVEVALTSLRQMVRSIGGQSTNQLERQNEYGARTASITWLVPAEQLDAAIAAVRALGEPHVLSFTTEDVTTSYFDVNSTDRHTKTARTTPRRSAETPQQSALGPARDRARGCTRTRGDRSTRRSHPVVGQPNRDVVGGDHADGARTDRCQHWRTAHDADRLVRRCGRELRAHRCRVGRDERVGAACRAATCRACLAGRESVAAHSRGRSACRAIAACHRPRG